MNSQPQAGRFDTRASIRTRYVGPTNTKGSRVTVCDDHPEQRRRLTVNWDPGLSSTENHHRAAMRFLNRHIDNAVIREPGLNFNGDYFWTWTWELDQ